MGFSKTEINLRRLLAAAPQQKNQAKLVHYIFTLREQLEELTAEVGEDNLPRLSKAKLNDYSEKIDAIATTLSVSLASTSGNNESVDLPKIVENPSRFDEVSTPTSSLGLRRRSVPHHNIEDSIHETPGITPSVHVKLDASGQSHIEKHRKLQEDLTDEMVELAQRLKESSFMMSKSLQDTEKILDSTEKAVEHSLASTGHANARAMEVYTESFKTTCFTWFIIFTMTCVFIMVVLLIRVT